MQLPDAFDIFVERISLGETPAGKIQSAANGLISFLSGSYGVSSDAVFLQGSYPNRTAVAPENADEGEYDVDLVCAGVDERMSCDDALTDIEARLAGHGTYAKLLRGEASRKKPCVRLFYAKDEIGAFHVDVVPARPSMSADPQASLEVPRRGDGWHDTAPAEYTKWCRDQGERFARTVRMLKRWRDHHQDARQSVKSIVLQVLAGTYLGSQGSDAEALVATLESIKQALLPHPVAAPFILNPVLRAENLAARWDAASYRDFLRQVDHACDLARRALSQTDAQISHDLWRDLLGPDFPEYDPDTRSVARLAVPATPAPGFHKRQAIPKRNEYGG